jgi:hypothetical protein
LGFVEVNLTPCHIPAVYILPTYNEGWQIYTLCEIAQMLPAIILSSWCRHSADTIQSAVILSLSQVQSSSLEIGTEQVAGKAWGA